MTCYPKRCEPFDGDEIQHKHLDHAFNRCVGGDKSALNVNNDEPDSASLPQQMNLQLMNMILMSFVVWRLT